MAKESLLLLATTTVQGVYLHGYDGQIIKLDPSTFEKLPSLRVLYLSFSKTHQFEFTHDFHGTFPNNLRYLSWDCYPLDSLGSNFKVHNLGGLIMKNSKLKKLWNETQDVDNLKYVDLDGSHELTCLPQDLSKANLQMLSLSTCTSLVDIPPLKFHHFRDNAGKDSGVMLKYKISMPQFINHEVYYAGNYNLLSFNWIKVFNNSMLDLNGCSNLKNLSKITGNIKFIRLSSTPIEELHSSIFFLKNLLVLDLHDCKCIKNLPNSLLNLESLEYLDMFGCVSIGKFPKLPKSIKGLDLSRTSIQQVDSSSFECLPCLSILYMNSCQHLENLPTTICKLESLVTLDLGMCSILESFPEILEPMEKIKKLRLNGSGIEEMPSSIENLVGLNELLLGFCENLKCIPTTIFKLKSLMKLDINFCPQLKIFPEIMEPMKNLEKLYLIQCGIEEIPSSIENLVGLNELWLRSCENLKCISTNIFKLKSLKDLDIIGCPRLKIFPEILKPMEKLQKLCYGSTFYSSIILGSEITTSQLHIEVEQFKCRMSCSTSINVFFRKDESDGLFCGTSFTCCECFILYSLHIILATRYFQERQFESRFRHYYPEYNHEVAFGGGIFSYLGNAVPKWFNYQSVGSSIGVKLFPSWDSNFIFLGYAICVVVDFDQCTSNPGHVFDLAGVKLDCVCHFKRYDGKSSRLSLHRVMPMFATYHGNDSDEDPYVKNNDNYNILYWSSDYVFIWYLDEFDSCRVEALFEFGVELYNSNKELQKCRIKHCGVHLVCRDDAILLIEQNHFLNKIQISES